MKDLKEEFWDRMGSVCSAMLGTKGQGSLPPMSPRIDAEVPREVWFITAKGTALAKSVAEGAQVGFGQRGDRVGDALGVTIGDDDLAPGFREGLGQLTAETVAGAGNQNSFVFKLRHGCTPKLFEQRREGGIGQLADVAERWLAIEVEQAPSDGFG